MDTPFAHRGAETLRVKMAKSLLKMYPKYNNRSFAIIVTGDETWMYFYEPKRKHENKI